MGTPLNMRTRKMCWDVMPHCAFCTQNVTILLYFLVQNEIYGRPTGTSL